MNQIIKAYEELANYGDILAEYINAIIVLPPQGDNSKNTVCREIKQVSNALIRQTKQVEKLVLQTIFQGGDNEK